MYVEINLYKLIFLEISTKCSLKRCEYELSNFNSTAKHKVNCTFCTCIVKIMVTLQICDNIYLHLDVFKMNALIMYIK